MLTFAYSAISDGRYTLNEEQAAARNATLELHDSYYYDLYYYNADTKVWSDNPENATGMLFGINTLYKMFYIVLGLFVLFKITT